MIDSIIIFVLTYLAIGMVIFLASAVVFGILNGILLSLHCRVKEKTLIVLQWAAVICATTTVFFKFVI